mmetsp:Transcript_43918/g.52685  ORF Transcript_43918/g.52685 Transcript_43918/m.52685 type:complete len:230 (-) Transcript_43918:403-1092(-)
MRALAVFWDVSCLIIFQSTPFLFVSSTLHSSSFFTHSSFSFLLGGIISFRIATSIPSILILLPLLLRLISLLSPRSDVSFANTNGSCSLLSPPAPSTRCSSCFIIPRMSFFCSSRLFVSLKHSSKKSIILVSFFDIAPPSLFGVRSDGPSSKSNRPSSSLASRQPFSCRTVGGIPIPLSKVSAMYIQNLANGGWRTVSDLVTLLPPSSGTLPMPSRLISNRYTKKSTGW